jgi:uncharacterized membrane protein (UPF0182 family)
VLVAFGDKIAMEETLDQALRAVFGRPAAPTPRMERPAKPTEPAGPVMAEQRLKALEKALEAALRELKELEKALEPPAGER